ncbi:hypothetical protein [Dactylosporangium sp. NPDC049140]|jgi:hypothetical protein
MPRISRAANAAVTGADVVILAMDYGRAKLIKDDWKSIFDDAKPDHIHH